VSQFILFTKYYKGDQVEEEELGRPHRTHGRGEKCKKNLSEKLKGRALGRHRHGRELLKWILENRCFTAKTGLNCFCDKS
jgi:hypothetical protein